MLSWTAARAAATAGDEAALWRALTGPLLATNPWFLVQLAKDDAAATRVTGVLLEKGVRVEAVDAMGNTPLHLAAKSPGSLRRLLDAGAPVNARNQRGHTPLMFAADQGPLASVQVLLADGADASVKDAQGGTALSFARSQRKADVVTALGGGRAPATKRPATRAAARRRPAVLEGGVVKGTVGQRSLEQALAPFWKRLPAPARAAALTAFTTGELEGHEVRLFEEPVTLRGDVTLTSGVALFAAGLEVQGTVRTRSDALLVVAGTLGVTNLLDEGFTVVGGALRAAELVLGDSGSDHLLVVGGELRARVVAETGHGIVVHGRMQATHALCLQNLIEHRVGRRRVQVRPHRGPLESIFVPEVLDDGDLSASLVAQHLGAGQSALAGEAG